MNLENFRQAYIKTITESADDSDLKDYIRTIVEEILSEAENENEARDDFKKNVKPLYNKDWGNEPNPFEVDKPMYLKSPATIEKGLDKKFVDALEKHVKDYGDYQIWNHYGDADGNPPSWWDSKNKKVKPRFIKK